MTSTALGDEVRKPIAELLLQTIENRRFSKIFSKRRLRRCRALPANQR